MISPIPGLFAFSAARRLSGSGSVAILVGMCLMPPHAAYAASTQCPSSYVQWTHQTALFATPASVATDTLFQSQFSDATYVTQGNLLFRFNNANPALNWVTPTLMLPVVSAPTVAP